MFVIADAYISYTELYGPKHANTGGGGVGVVVGVEKKIRLN